jgi:hypothetical protein
MVTIIALLAASQVPLAPSPEELRWRRFVHHAVATETPFSTRMSDLHRSVGQLREAPRLPRPRGTRGPSGL